MDRSNGLVEWISQEIKELHATVFSSLLQDLVLLQWDPCLVSIYDYFLNCIVGSLAWLTG
jgi:hypothetical protein